MGLVDEDRDEFWISRYPFLCTTNPPDMKDGTDSFKCFRKVAYGPFSYKRSLEFSTFAKRMSCLDQKDFGRHGIVSRPVVNKIARTRSDDGLSSIPNFSLDMVNFNKDKRNINLLILEKVVDRSSSKSRN